MRALALVGATIVAASLFASLAGHANAEDDELPKGAADTGNSGPLVTYATRPTLLRETKACSMRLPLCVVADAHTQGRIVLDVLAAAERAWDMLAGAFGLHAPDGDPSDLAYPIYIVRGAREAGETLVAARDVRSRIDRTRSLTVLAEEAVTQTACARDALIAREIAHAFMFRAAPATAEAIARSQTTYLAQLMVPCALGFDGADDARAFQTRPERTICEAEQGPPDAVSDRFRSGAALFWRRIDWAYGRGPGSILTAAWALAPTTTPALAERWHDEPDAFDVLRVSFKGALSTKSTLHDLLLDTAIARAFMGSDDDGLHAPETRTLGDAARITADWNLPWPKKPRRVAPRAPVAPTGASYLFVRLDGAPKNARLRVEIVWEEHALFRWAFVKLDTQARELGRIVIPTAERATSAQMTLTEADAADRILLVGVNVGDPAYGFDPDDEFWEPHGWLLTIAEE